MPVTTELRVRYAETDQMGVVYYGNYFVWTEIGRVELMRSAGPSYDQLEKEYRLILPVVETSCRYRSPAHYDDQIVIETRPTLVKSSVVKFAYRILRKNAGGQPPTLLAESESVHVVCDSQMNKKHLPEPFAKALRSMMSPEKMVAETPTPDTAQPEPAAR